jgi:hypothetical protein
MLTLLICIGRKYKYRKEKHRRSIRVYRNVGLEAYIGYTKYLFVSRHQNSEQNHNLLIAKKSFQNVAKLKCLETRVKNQNYIKYKLRAD